MSQAPKIFLSALLGFFFSVAMLEVDVFDYENTFLDSYDSYVKLDSKLTHKILDVEFDRFASPEIVLPVYVPSSIEINSFPEEPRSSNYFYRPKLFLIKSSLLI